MSGILDAKSRVLDVILTDEGKKQLSNGLLKIEHISFSDDSTFYESDIVSGTAETKNRVFFECSNLPQDSITLEANDAGKLNPFKNANNINVINGKIITYTSNTTTGSIMTGSVITLHNITGSQFASLSETLLSSSFENFSFLRLLSTKNYFVDDSNFKLSTNEVKFDITNQNINKVVSINELDGLLTDSRLNTQNNFKFLPPINKKNHINDINVQLGTYVNLSKQDMTNHNLIEHLNYLHKIGLKKEINISETSDTNKLLCQFFETTNNEIKKLDVLDRGFVLINNSPHRIFFIGKIFIDDNNDDTFVNLFTLVFS